jgi:hypothetical protein
MKIFCQYIRWGYLAHSEDGQHRSGDLRTGMPADAARLVADKAFGEGNYTLKRIASKLYEATPLPKS